jgi:Ser/Thr protein kinase RdoA (MazF antagonist)
MEWLAALNRDTSLVVPEPVPTRDGELLTVVEVEGVPEPRICALFRWVEGRFLDAGLTPAHLERVGGLMARLHLHAEGYAPPEGFTRWRVADVSEEVSEYSVGTVAELYGQRDATVVREVVRKVRDAQRALDGEPGTSGLVHADLHQENYLFRGGRVSPIDFDDCGWGYFVYDLAVTLSELRGREDYEALREGLLRGYRAVRPLAAEHERYLAIFDAMRLLLLTLWFLEQRHHPGFPQWEAEVRGGLQDLTAFIEA